MLALLLTAAAEVAEPTLAGYWTNEAQTLVILIAPCGAEVWCGTVQSASAKARADAARGGTANLVGSRILYGVVAVAPRRWKGTLFVPDLNKRSKAELVQLDSDRIVVRGCAVGRLLCKAQVWRRLASATRASLR